jgi:hypothetical protein
MSKLAVLLAGLMACASGDPVSQIQTPHPVAAIAPAIVAQFPVRRSTPELRRAHALPSRALGDNPLTAQLQVCVSPHGETASVAIRGSSGDHIFDNAVVDDISEWRYEPFAAPDNSVACRLTTVTSVP